VRRTSAGTRRTVNEALVSIGALVLLLSTLIAIDPRVREQFAMRFGNGGAAYEIGHAGNQLSDIASVIAQAVRHQTIEHSPFTIFVVVAVVLTLFMFRT
jgi:hypothetical protein